MKVLFKIPLALGCLILAYGAVTFAVGKLYIQPSFETLESRTARSDLDRLTAAIMREGHHLANLDRDWSAWDETYAFVAGAAPSYIERNLSADSWKQTGVDLIAIYAGGRLQFEGSLDRQAGRVVAEALFPATAPEDAPYLRSDGRPDDLVGFILSPRGVYLLAATPILPTSGQGRVRGTFLMGQLIGEDFSAEVSDQTNVRTELRSPADLGPIELERLLAAGGSTFETSATGSDVIGRGVLNDLWGSPALVVQSRTPREITAWSARTLRISLAMILALGLAFVAVQYVLLQRTVAGPLRALEGQVRRREQEEQAVDLASMSGRRDEIGSLAAAFQHLDESLFTKRLELRQANERLEARVAERTKELHRASENERLLAKVVEYTGDAVLITDLSGTILRVNEAFCRASGYAEAELLGKNARILKSGRHDAAFYAAFWSRLTRDGTWQGEIWDRSKSGQLYPRWLTVNLVRDEAGNPSCYVGVSTDLSNLIAAEDRLRLLNRLYRATSRTNQLIVHEKSRDRLLHEICRIAVEDGGVLMAWVGFVDPVSRAVVPAAWFGREEGYLSCIQVSALDVPQGKGPTGTAIRENRRMFVADISAEPVMTPWRQEALRRGYRSSAAFPLVENRQPVGAFITYAGEVGFFDEQALSLMDDLTADISYAVENLAREEERARLQEQFLQAQKMEAVGRLAGGVAHDFNNILTAIIGYSEMGFTASTDKLKDFFQQIRQAARRAAGLTLQLLAFSRRQIVQPRRLDLGALVAGVIDMLKRLIGEDVVIRTERAAGLWSVLADPGQIEQVIMNLAVNARDAMPGGGTLTIGTSNVTLGEEPAADSAPGNGREFVLLSVSDTGHGMDSATLARIYDPFFTTKEVGKGTGLGLATVYGIVKQSGGRIRCDSEPGRGTTFRVYLPRSRKPEEEGPSVEPHHAAAAGHETILFVDDDEAVRGVAVSILQAAGYSVISARDGADCLALAPTLAGAPHLLVTDVVMPGLDGVQTARRLAERFPGLRVLYISGYAKDTFLSHASPPAGMELLRKPFSPAELLKKVREKLDSGPTLASA